MALDYTLTQWGRTRPFYLFHLSFIFILGPILTIVLYTSDLYSAPVSLPANGIIDNGSQGTLSTGNWKLSSGENPYNGGSLYLKPSGNYEYSASGVNGNKEVSLWWTYYDNRCDSVPVDIYDGNTLIDTVYVDQLANGGRWNILGTYGFSGTARVVINSLGAGDCTTCADAVKIDNPLVLPQDGIIDNGSQGTSVTGKWNLSSGANPYGPSSLYANSSAIYTYGASGVDGEKEVSLWWTYYNNRCTSVPVDIYDGTQFLATVNVNQKKNGSQWNSLGRYIFNSGTTKIVINSLGGCTTNADAVKIATLSGASQVLPNVDFTIKWDPNTGEDVSGYKVHYGNSSRNYQTQIDVANQTYYNFSGPAQAYYIAITAYDSSGRESAYSNEVIYN